MIKRGKMGNQPKPSNLRVLAKPILNLFYGERNGKRWKCLMDAELNKSSSDSFSKIIENTIHVIDDEILDATPDMLEIKDIAFATGKLPKYEFIS